MMSFTYLEYIKPTPIPFNNPTHLRLKGPKVFLKFKIVEIILSKDKDSEGLEVKAH
jgi:hypothetical protein